MIAADDRSVLALRGLFAAGVIYGQNPSYLSERFPTEVRATAAGFCYHQGAIFAYFAASWHTGFAIPMLVGTTAGLISFIAALLCGPETKGKELVPDLVVF
jgi:SHS family lactate transporter-like MFS transporter